MVVDHKAIFKNSKVLIQIETGAGKVKEITLNCSSRQYVDGMRAYREGQLIQNAFPFLNADEREFLMTGITPEEWDAMFKEK